MAEVQTGPGSHASGIGGGSGGGGGGDDRRSGKQGPGGHKDKDKNWLKDIGMSGSFQLLVMC